MSDLETEIVILRGAVKKLQACEQREKLLVEALESVSKFNENSIRNNFISVTIFEKLQTENQKLRKGLDFYASGEGERDYSQVTEFKPMYEIDTNNSIGIDGMDNIQKNKGVRHGKMARQILAEVDGEI